jgi:hypothetical protein
MDEDRALAGCRELHASIPLPNGWRAQPRGTGRRRSPREARFNARQYQRSVGKRRARTAEYAPDGLFLREVAIEDPDFEVPGAEGAVEGLSFFGIPVSCYFDEGFEKQPASTTASSLALSWGSSRYGI